MLLEGKAAIVTGAGSGSAALPRCASPRKVRACVCADINGDAAKETVRQIEAAGGTAVAVSSATSRTRADVIAMIAAAVDQFGRLDILFNNVGIPTPRLGALLEDHTVEDFDRLTAVNFRGVFLGCKHAVLQFKKQGGGGVILNTGSVAGLVGWGGSVYGATKGAVHQLTRAVAIEGAPLRHPRQCDLPGRDAVHRLHGRRRHEPDRRSARAASPQQVGSSHPLGPADHRRGLRGGAVYLVSDRAANVTGVLLPVDGGYVAR